MAVAATAANGAIRSHAPATQHTPATQDAILSIPDSIAIPENDNPLSLKMRDATALRAGASTLILTSSRNINLVNGLPIFIRNVSQVLPINARNDRVAISGSATLGKPPPGKQQ